MNKIKYLFLISLLFSLLNCNSSVFNLVKLTSTSAVCLDGTNAAYYISQDGDPKKIYLQFQGGGWSGSLDLASTLESFYQRSKTNLGSTKNYTERATLNQGSLSGDVQNNFHGWKRVLILYCDGCGHQGTKKQPVPYKDTKLYFRGHNITVQTLQSLEKKVKLFSEATEVVVGGDSAGGLAVYFWTNYIASRVKNGRVRALPDSGIFLDSINVKYNKATYRQSFENLMKIANIQIDIPVPECVQNNKQNPVNCFFAQNLHRYIKVPQFPIQSLYDTWSIPNILGISCISAGSLAGCSQSDKRTIQQYHRNTTNVLFEIGANIENGFWAPVCANHVYARSTLYYSPNFRIPQNSQFSVTLSVQNWLDGKSNQNKHIDLTQWPDNKPCSGVRQFQLTSQ